MRSVPLVTMAMQAWVQQTAVVCVAVLWITQETTSHRAAYPCRRIPWDTNVWAVNQAMKGSIVRGETVFRDRLLKPHVKLVIHVLSPLPVQFIVMDGPSIRDSSFRQEKIKILGEYEK